MSKKAKIFLQSFITLALFAVTVQVMAVWQAPSTSAPAGNPEPPINVGGTTQTKSGILAVSGFTNHSSSLFTGLAVFNGGLKIPSGAASGKVLTSDADGDVSWEDPAPGGGGSAGGWTDDGAVVRLTTSSNKVGVGTTTPVAKLSISGLTFSSGGFKVANESGGTVNGAPWYGLGQSNFGFLQDGGDYTQLAGYYGLFFKTDNGEVVIDRNGNVGIGETDPQFELDVDGTVNAGSALCINGDCRSSWPGGSSGSQTPWAQNVNANGYTLYGNDGIGVDGKLTLDSTSASTKGFIVLNPLGGNVGIGTTNPGSKLQVAGMIESTTDGFKFPDNTVQTTAVTPHGKMKYIHTGAVGSIKVYTFVVPAEVTKVWVTISAGGGGGGGGQGIPSGTGGGGGGGQVHIAEAVAVTPGQQISIGVGGGGAGGSAVGEAGDYGRNSLFGSLDTVGGGGGQSNNGGSAGGFGGNSGLNGDKGGFGGDSIYGNGGVNHGEDGTGYGGGGNGGGTNNETKRGGNGAPGFVLVEW